MSQPQRHIIIGTAGHIDHGKSAIVRALTGTDPDRLKEEKERGMTIDLGYAFYNDYVAFVDVPGHERFIKNMVAGVTSIDFVLFVVAADDGVMPQTREHLDILNLLGIERGIVVINKVDLVEADWVDLIKEDVRDLTKGTLLEDAPIVTFSAPNEHGIEELRTEIDRMLMEPLLREDRGYFWMPVDRSFTIHGFGTVATGSVNSGELNSGEEVEMLPSEKVYKVRGLQRHGKDSNQIFMGDRGAINLQGVHKNMIRRGQVLCTPGVGMASTRLDASLQLLSSSPWTLKDQSRVRLHIGTSEILARIRLLDCEELSPGASGLVQLILEKPVAANRSDRYVIRYYSPSITIGGGKILDNSPIRRHKRFDKELLQYFLNMQSEDKSGIILNYLQYGRKPRSIGELVGSIGMAEKLMQGCLSKLEKQELVFRIDSGGRPFFLASPEVDEMQKTVIGLLGAFHKSRPDLPGMARAELRSKFSKSVDEVILEAVLEKLSKQEKINLKGDRVSLAGFSAGLSEKQRILYAKMLDIIEDAHYSPPNIKELNLMLDADKTEIDLLINYGKNHRELILLQNGLIYKSATFEEIQKVVRNWIQENGSITAAELRDQIRASRKFAISLLEYFDHIGFTVRDGDQRFLNH